MTAADLDERRILGPARRLIEKLPVAAGGGRGRLTTPVRTPQVGGPAVSLEKNRGTRGSKRNENKDLSLEKLKCAKAPRETAIQRQIINYLNAQPGAYAWKAGAGLIPTADGRRVRMGKAGVADVIGLVRVHRELGAWRRCANDRCLHPHVAAWLAVEVKRPKGGKPVTPTQLDFLARLREAGSPLAMVATSVDEVRWAVERL